MSETNDDDPLRHLVLDGTTERIVCRTGSTNSIGWGQFIGSQTLETVQILEKSGIISIGTHSFSGCTSLRSVHLANGTIRKIGEGAFNGCTSLQSIRLPAPPADSSSKSTLVTIGRNTFYQCTSLKSIDIPDGVVDIGTNAFSRCTSLKSVVIPNSVTNIGYYAFDCCTSLKSVAIPNTITAIEPWTFDACKSLRSIQIPESVTTIGGYAFCECESLQSIFIPNVVTTIERREQDPDIEEYFDIEEHDLDDGEEFAFHGCKRLEQRQRNGRNYHTDTLIWLRQRFDDLPIHRACYYANDDTQSRAVVDLLSTLLQENKRALAATDAMGMTPLHILSCNPHISVEMVQLLVKKDPSLLTCTDVTESTPLQLFLCCRGLFLGGDVGQHESIASFCDGLLKGTINVENLAVLFILNGNNNDVYLFEKGTIKEKDLAILFILNSNQGEINLLGQDESTGLLPFMSAAVSPACGLDVAYALAMNNLDKIT